MAKPKLSFSILIASVIVKICLSSTAMAQEKKLPEELKPFIPAGYEMLDFVTGHLDNDNSNDAILILKVAGEDSITDSERMAALSASWSISRFRNSSFSA